MSSTLTSWKADRPERTQEYLSVEAVARQMAEMTGVNWDALTNYPGFEKGRWRSMASDLLVKARKG